MADLCEKVYSYETIEVRLDCKYLFGKLMSELWWWAFSIENKIIFLIICLCSSCLYLQVAILYYMFVSAKMRAFFYLKPLWI